MKNKDFIEILKKFPEDYDVVIPPEDYVKFDIYKDDTFEQVCIEYSPMTKKDLFKELIEE